MCKILNVSLSSLMFMLTLIACSPQIGGDPYPPSFDKFTVATIPAEQLPAILADTITPPSNPMAPEDLSSYPSFKGTLTLNNYMGEYYASIQDASKVYFLLDHTNFQLLRFDSKVLSPYIVGDTIIVTGKLYELVNSGKIALTTYFIQSAQ